MMTFPASSSIFEHRGDFGFPTEILSPLLQRPAAVSIFRTRPRKDEGRVFAFEDPAYSIGVALSLNDWSSALHVTAVAQNLGAAVAAAVRGFCGATGKARPTTWEAKLLQMKLFDHEVSLHRLARDGQAHICSPYNQELTVGVVGEGPAGEFAANYAHYVGGVGGFGDGVTVRWATVGCEDAKASSTESLLRCAASSAQNNFLLVDQLPCNTVSIIRAHYRLAGICDQLVIFSDQPSHRMQHLARVAMMLGKPIRRYTGESASDFQKADDTVWGVPSGNRVTTAGVWR